MNATLRIGLTWVVAQYSEDILAGAIAYSRQFGPFRFLGNFGPELDCSQLCRRNDFHGMLVYRTHDNELNGVQYPPDIPIVSTAFIDTVTTPYQVLTDNPGVGRLAAEEFLSRGLRCLAYCPHVWLERPSMVPLGSAHWCKGRRDGFVAAAHAAGAAAYVYDADLRVTPFFENEWNGPLAEWIKSLPKPVGIMAANDYRARHILLACEVAGARVPDDVAVIGVDNLTWTQITDPPISSVQLDGYRVGYAAMQMLHHLIIGKAVDPKVIHVPPRRLIRRGSSDMLAIGDSDVIAAMQYIEQNAARGISVEQVVDAVAVSRRGLERRFQHWLHSSILDKIRFVQIERAKGLLAEGAVPIHSVAKASGFSSAVALSTIFHRVTGMTPTAYRAAELAAKIGASDPDAAPLPAH